MGAAEELVGGGRGERGVGDEPRQLVRVREQVGEAEADRVPRRLVPGRRQQDEHRPELLLGEPRAVELRLDELRGDVVARLARDAPRRAFGRTR